MNETPDRYTHNHTGWIGTPKTRTFHVNIGTPEVGHWCDHCMTPALVRLPLTYLREDGVLSLGHAWMCTDCNEGIGKP